MELIHKQNLAKFTFMYLLSLVTLIMTALAVGNVLFELINKFVADPLVSFSSGFDSTSIKMGIATLIIAGPLYFWTSITIFRSLASGHLDREATPRRWLTYLIILVSSFVMLGYLIGVLFSFLDGEITMRFTLKALVSLLLAGGIFGFYFYDVRRDKIDKNDPVIKYSAIAAMVVVLLSLIVSFFFIESPTQARNRKHDQALTNNFDQIDSSLNSYYTENKKLPTSLAVVVGEKRYLSDTLIKDPSTGVAIDYKVLADKKYQLCATFLMSNIGANPSVDYSVTRWPHDKGRQCITQQIFQADAIPTIKGAPITVPLTK
jgi:hypothetical protein